MSKNNRAVTLTELTMVVVAIGVMASFAIPNYSRSIAKSHERTAISNLVLMRTAVNMYLANTGDAAIPVWANLAEINTGLGLSLVDNVSTYHCWPVEGSAENGCTATHPSGWSIHTHVDATDSLHCTDPLGNPCPNCAGGGGDGGCGI